MVRNFGDGEYSLRSVGVRRGREFGCTYFLNGNAALSQRIKSHPPLPAWSLGAGGHTGRCYGRSNGRLQTAFLLSPKVELEAARVRGFE